MMGINAAFHSKLVRSIAIYTSFSVLQKCIPFLLFPLFARIFSEEDMGYYILYQAIYVLAFPLFTLSTNTAVSVNFYKLERQNFNRYLTNVLTGTFVYFVVGLIAFLFFYRWLASLIEFPALWLLIVVISVLPRFLINSLLSLFRCRNDVVRYGVLASLATISVNLIGICLVFTTTLGWRAIILGTLIGDSLVACACVYMLAYLKYFDFHFVGEYLKDALKMGIPICFHVLGGWLSNSLSRFFITTLIGVAATGSYGIGATFSMMLNLIIDSFNLAFDPYLSQRLVTFSPDDKKSIFKVSLLYYLVIIVATVMIILVGYYFVGFIFGDKYISTREFIIPLILGSALNGFYKVHVNYLFFSKKTYLIASVTFALGMCNVGLSYAMVKYGGLLGAAYASVIISFCSYMAIAYLANREYPMNWIHELKFTANYLLKR